MCYMIDIAVKDTVSYCGLVCSEKKCKCEVGEGIHGVERSSRCLTLLNGDM